jgi:hypothetical protein
LIWKVDFPADRSSIGQLSGDSARGDGFGGGLDDDKFVWLRPAEIALKLKLKKVAFFDQSTETDLCTANDLHQGGELGLEVYIYPRSSSRSTQIKWYRISWRRWRW